MKDQARIAEIAQAQSAFSHTLGITLTHASENEVRTELVVTPALANRNGVMHGGAILALADNNAGTAAMIAVGPGQSTTTVESKTNFLRPIRIGDTAYAHTVPAHIGNTTTIWQTSITRGDGKLAALITQTQMTIIWREG